MSNQDREFWCEFISSSDQDESDVTDAIEGMSFHDREELIDFVFEEGGEFLSHYEHLVFMLARVGFSRILQSKMAKSRPDLAGQEE